MNISDNTDNKEQRINKPPMGVGGLSPIPF